MRIIRRLLKLVLRIAIVLVVIMAVAYLYFSITWGRALDRELTRLRKAGVHLSPAQFAPPPVPDRENAALLYEAAAKQVKIAREDWELAYKVLDAVVAGKKPLSTLSALRPIVEKNQRALSLVEQAAQLPRSRFPVDWGDGGAVVFRPLARVKEVARPVPWQVLVLASQGDVAGALRASRAGLRLAEAVGAEPGIISQLVDYAVWAIMLHNLRMLEEVSDLPPAQAHDLFSHLQRVNLVTGSVRAVEYERALGVWEFGEIDRDPSKFVRERLEWSGDISPGPGDRFWIRLYGSFLGALLRKHDELAYLKTMAQLAGQAKVPYRQSKPGHDKLTRDAERLPAWDLRTRLVPPVYARLSQKRDEAQAEIGACQIGLALNVYRQRFHRYPATLAELERAVGWTLPKDPFSGKDYSYRREGKGLALSSWGPALESEEAEWRARLRERLTWRWRR